MNVIMGPIYIDRIERIEPPSARRQRVCFTVDKAEKYDSPMSYCLGYGLDTSGSLSPTPPSWMRRQSCVRVLHVSRRFISCSLAAAARARSSFEGT